MKQIASLLFLVLLSTNLFSQKKMVLIEGFQQHEIEVSDQVSKEAVLEFFWWMRKNRVPYHQRLTELKRVSVVPMASYKNHHYHKGVIYIAEYANHFPNIKRVLILNELGTFYGLPEQHVIPLDNYNEQKYLYRRKYYKDIKRIIYQLKTPQQNEKSIN